MQFNTQPININDIVLSHLHQLQSTTVRGILGCKQGNKNTIWDRGKRPIFGI